MATRAPRTTLTTSFARRFYERSQEASILRWPNPRYENDIEGFARDILGIRFWSKQRDFAEKLQKSKRVAAKAGQKVSKTCTLAIRALHFYCTYDDARVFVTAPTFAQVKDPMWKEISRLVRRSGTCADCRDHGITDPCEHSCPIDGMLNISPLTGLIAGDRAIVGISTRQANNVSGKSGPHMLWILDEVIGIDVDVFEAILGTQAGGAWMAIASNPTENDQANEFCLAFTKKAHLYDTITIASTDSPNCTGECKIPGLATPEWVEEKRQEWGEDSAAFQTRIKGEFATRGTETMLSPTEIRKSQIRWETQVDDGVLAIGIDVAGAATGNDSWSFSVRRGWKVIELTKEEGLDSADGIRNLEAVLARHQVDGEVPQVAFDGSSHVGREFGIALAQYSRRYPNKIAPRSITPSASPPNDRFDRLRDYLLWNLAECVQRSLGIPFNEDLEEELLALKWDWQRSDKTGKDKVIDKAKLRRILGRSPDLADAISYCIFGIERDNAPQPNLSNNPNNQNRAQNRANPHNRIMGYDPFKNNPQFRRR